MAESWFQGLEDERRLLLDHPLFSNIRSLDDVRALMEVHVYAVWDFMSLLKRLQIDLTCVQLPWRPSANKKAARLINEIVIAEESDEAPDGGFSSHLELYLHAMAEIGANTMHFLSFIRMLELGEDVPGALARARVPEFAARFVQDTLQVAQNGTTEEVLAYFFFGREDLIPDMFSRLLSSWAIPESSVPALTYYLRRHIELDGDDHGPAARNIIHALVTTTAGRERIVHSARCAIASRRHLWDGVLGQLRSRAMRAIPSTA